MWKIKRELCMRCGACVGVCPFMALELSEHGIKRDPEKCTLCGLCAKACPAGAITVKKNDSGKK